MFKDYPLVIPAWFGEEETRLVTGLYEGRQRRMERFSTAQYYEMFEDMYGRMRPDLAVELTSGIRKLPVDELDQYLINVTAYCLHRGLVQRPEPQPSVEQTRLEI